MFEFFFFKTVLVTKFINSLAQVFFFVRQKNSFIIFKKKRKVLREIFIFLII